MPRAHTPKIVFLDRNSLPWPLRRAKLPHRWQEHPHTAMDERLSRLAGATIAISNKVPLDGDLLLQLPELKLVAVAATGINLIDLASCRKLGIGVCNIRGYANTTVAEHTFSLILALRRNLFAYRDAVHRSEWQHAKQFCLMQYPVQDLSGSSLGIIGKGALGESVARLGRAFGMNVLFAERKNSNSLRPGYTPFDEVIQEADVVSLHCPLNDETQNLIGERELVLMKPSSILINTARGNLVDEEALVDALLMGRIAGAGIDVLSQEPPANGNPLLKPELPNLVVTPHCAWLGNGALAELAEQLIDNIEAFLHGEPKNLV